MAVSDPIATFTREHPKTGEKQERLAYAPSEAVQLRADGWVEKKTATRSSSSSTSTTTTTAASSGGSKPASN